MEESQPDTAEDGVEEIISEPSEIIEPDDQTDSTDQTEQEPAIENSDSGDTAETVTEIPDESTTAPAEQEDKPQ